MVQITDSKRTTRVLDEKAIDNFPCEDLQIIDRFWVSTSNGKFGFSVQKDIYQSLGGKRVYNERIWNNFGDRVGWKRGHSWLSYDEYTFNLNAPMGHLPISNNWFLAFGGRMGDRQRQKTYSSLTQRLISFNI